MAYMKTMVECVVDVGPTMAQPLGAFSSKLRLVSAFLGTHMIQRKFQTTTAEYGVSAYGDVDYPPERTYRNYLNDTIGGYENVHQIVGLKRINETSIHLLLEDLRVGNAPGDMIDGIVVGLDSLVRTNSNYKFNRVMVLITDGETPLEDLDDLDPILVTMVEKQISVYVLMLGSVVENTSSKTKVHTSNVLRRIAETTGGRYMAADDLADCMPLLASAPGLSTRPQQKKQVLEIAPYMRIPCIVWKKVNVKSLPSLKKTIRPPDAGSSSGQKDRGDDGDGTTPPMVSRETRYMNPHDEGEEVTMEERIKGYRYGTQYIPLSAEQLETVKICGPCRVQLIGFVAAASIPRHHCLQHSQVLVGDPNISTAVSAIASLIDAMTLAKDVALVRFVSASDADPYLAALMPSTAPAGALLVHRLPFCEDVREYAFPSYDTESITPAQTAAVSDFVQSMTIPSAATASTKIARTFNPTKQAMFIELLRRAGADHDLPAVDGIPPALRCFRTPWLALGEEGGEGQSSQRALKLAALFPLKVTPEGAKEGAKRRSYWGDFQIEVSGLGEEEGHKRLKVGTLGPSQAAPEEVPSPEVLARQREEARVGVARGAVGQFVRTVGGLVDQLEEFEGVLGVVTSIARVAVKEEGAGGAEGGVEGGREAISESAAVEEKCLLVQAMKAMLPVVKKMVEEAGTNPHLRKAVAIVRTFRATVVAEAQGGIAGLGEAFNAILREHIKQPYSTGKHRGFWKLFVDERLTLLSTAEDPSCGVTPAQAQEFLQVAAVPVPIAVQAEAEEGDVFDEME